MYTLKISCNCPAYEGSLKWLCAEESALRKKFEEGKIEGREEGKKSRGYRDSEKAFESRIRSCINIEVNMLVSRRNQ